MNILEEWKNVVDAHLKKIAVFLNDCKFVSKEYDKSKQEIFDIGFNAFTIMSDLYKRENFHSDIIKAILDPEEKHNQKEKYLFLFIDLLNKIRTPDLIDKNDFKHSVVIREKENRIDILIKNDLSKKAIIIENKINNAGDMQKQLPRYYEGIVKQGYSVEGIVYLTLDLSKKPHKTDWTDKEIEKINDLLIIIPAYAKYGKLNLYEHWLMPAMIETQDIDSLFLLKQYGNLLKYLNTNNMDTVSLEKFYNTLKQNDNLKTSISIRNMLNDLPEYLAIRIEDKYKNHCYPFKNVWRYKQRDTVFEACELESIYLKLDIWCSENGYDMSFWTPQPTENYDIKDNFKDVEMLNDFEYENNQKYRIIKHFDFDENSLFDFIDKFLTVLTEKKKND